jgi:hypothetical protein
VILGLFRFRVKDLLSFGIASIAENLNVSDLLFLQMLKRIKKLEGTVQWMEREVKGIKLLSLHGENMNVLSSERRCKLV